MKVGFLGTGDMGTPMALRLIAAGHDLSVWNRSEGRATPVIHDGAIAAGTPAEAELGADAVITMLSDDEAYEHVLFGPNGLFDALSPGSLHVSCSNISVALSQRLTQDYEMRGVHFVAAPVFGNPLDARHGNLWVVAAGANAALNRARPLLEALSRGITVVGKDPRLAHALKLGGDFLVTAMIQSLSEAFVFADRQGIEPGIFLDTVNNALFQSPLYTACAGIMLNPPEHSAATIHLAMKDLRLLREAAAHSHTHLSFADHVAEILSQAIRTGITGQDLAVLLYQNAQHQQTEKP